MQAGTFAETAYPFRESQLMQGIGELGRPQFQTIGQGDTGRCLS